MLLTPAHCIHQVLSILLLCYTQAQQASPLPTVKLFFFQEAILNPRLPYVDCPRQRGRLLIGKPHHCIKIIQTNISLHKIYSIPHKPVLAPQIESILFYSPLSFFFLLLPSKIEQFHYYKMQHHRSLCRVLQYSVQDYRK